MILKRIQILAGILVMICTGMLFAQKTQAAGEPAKTGSARIRLNSTSLVLMKGDTWQLRLKNAERKVSWKSTKNRVASVSSRGVVKAQKAGTCVITAKSAGCTYQCMVRVCTNKKKYKYRLLQDTYETSGHQNKIILAGSSCIAHWSDAEDAFWPYEVLNMGIGGSKARQWLKWYKKLIVAYNPCAVVLYPGTRNELRRYSVEAAISDTSRLLKKLHRELPDVPIYYVSIFRNFRDLKIWSREERCNERIKELCAELENVHYIDVTGVLSDGEKPRTDIFTKDGLHMNDDGYLLWDEKVVPIVKKALQRKKILDTLQIIR